MVLRKALFVFTIRKLPQAFAQGGFIKFFGKAGGELKVSIDLPVAPVRSGVIALVVTDANGHLDLVFWGFSIVFLFEDHPVAGLKRNRLAAEQAKARIIGPRQLLGAEATSVPLEFFAQDRLVALERGEGNGLVFERRSVWAKRTLPVRRVSKGRRDGDKQSESEQTTAHGCGGSGGLGHENSLLWRAKAWKSFSDRKVKLPVALERIAIGVWEKTPSDIQSDGSDHGVVADAKAKTPAWAESEGGAFLASSQKRRSN